MTGEILCALASTLFPKTNSGNIKTTTSSSENVDLGKKEETEMTNSESLTKHPAKKFIMDFVRIIVVDSLAMPITSKSLPVIDLLLEAIPEHSTKRQRNSFQAEILSSLMDYLLDADILLGEQSSLPIAAQGSYSNIAGNVFYLAGRIVDKLWQGIITRDSHDVFSFIVKLISQAKRRASALSLDAVYRSLNRTILYQLSRAIDTVADQMAVLEALHKVTTNRALVLGPGNYELEFIACLCYCLLQLTEEITVSCDTNRRTVWHVNPTSGNDLADTPSQYRTLATQEGQGLLATAAKRVWEELYVCKKPAIEEVFKVTFPNSEKTPELHTIRNQIYELSNKTWLTYIESEQKSTSSKSSWELQSHLQSKIQKVTGGFSRLTNRKLRKEETIKICLSPHSPLTIQNWTFTHIGVVKDLVEFQYKQTQQSHQHMQKYLYEDWLQTEAELTRERGLWGSMQDSQLDKWMLDMTEGPCRMLKKLMRNEAFYIDYPHRPEFENGDNALKYKVAMSYDSKEYYEKHRPAGLVEGDALPFESHASVSEDLPVLDSEVIEEGSFRTWLLPRTSRIPSDMDDDVECGDTENNNSEEESSEKPDTQTLLRLLEEGEKISHMFRCARIQGLDTYEGLLLFGKEHFYVVDGFTLLKTREIRDIDFLPPGMHEPIIPNSPNCSSKKGQKKVCSKFAYDEIREVHKRRYLLQPIALEIFSSDGRNYLLAFPRGFRNKVYQRCMAVATAINDNAQQSVAGQKRTASVEQGAGIFSTLIGETSVTQRWVRGEISNFQYLMHLNTLAGRSYNDLMQYPVFPWILADYESQELDLTNKETFRDFSKPMGAQSPDRLEQFRKRYKEWDDPHGETPPYHYGTHYSSAMIVASYLVRMEPFTQHFLKLQGGHFDLADRMFHSVKEAWLSASKHNMADVKELIPEFFYLPEFLLNSNNFDLGAKQNGVQLHNVVLPAWAKDDTREFIRVHRMALECDYVSAHLHEWIDLLFGYKQHGPPALEAVNVFHHLFYEGNVDIYTIEDPLKKNATIGFINNFGQIPKQLFKKPHPSKKLNQKFNIIDPTLMTLNITPPDRLFFHNLDNLKPTMQPIKELKAAVGQIYPMEKTVFAVEQNKVLVPPTAARYVAWGFADHSLRVGNYESEKAVFVCELNHCGEILCCSCPNTKLIITGGTSAVVNVWHFGKKNLVLRENLYGHTEAVTCVTSSSPYNIIVSGSRDQSCIIWDMTRLIFVRQLKDHGAPVSAVAINDLTGDIATCAGTYLYLWTINGQPISYVNTNTGRSDRTQQILCVAFSQMYEWDSSNVVMTGSSDGIVRMWSVDFVQVPEDTKELLENTVDVESPNVSNDSCELFVNAGDKLCEEKVQEYVRKMSLVSSQDEDFYCLGITSPVGGLKKCGSDSSLSEEEVAEVPGGIAGESVPESKDGLLKISVYQEVGIEMPSNIGLTTRNIDGSSEKISKTGFGSTVHIQRSSTIFTSAENKSTSIRASKSDTSLADSYIFITDDEVNDMKCGPCRKECNKNDSILREGFKWNCQVIFRGKLTMHTAFERKDNAEPSGITALAVSKDHKSIYVGDGRGRIFSWSVTDHPGQVVADHWVKDEGGDNCSACRTKFTFADRRHHCRNCGQLFCSRCSRFESAISRLRIVKPVRVCQECFYSLKPPKSLEITAQS